MHFSTAPYCSQTPDRNTIPTLRSEGLRGRYPREDCFCLAREHVSGSGKHGLRFAARPRTFDAGRAPARAKTGSSMGALRSTITRLAHNSSWGFTSRVSVGFKEYMDTELSGVADYE